MTEPNMFQGEIISGYRQNYHKNKKFEFKKHEIVNEYNKDSLVIHNDNELEDSSTSQNIKNKLKLPNLIQINYKELQDESQIWQTKKKDPNGKHITSEIIYKRL